MIFRRTVLLLCGALLVCVLSACGGEGEDTSEAAVDVVATYSILGGLDTYVGMVRYNVSTMSEALQR